MTLLTIREVADRLGYCPETVRLLTKSGELTRVQRPGCSIRVPEASVTEYLEKHTWPDQESRPGSTDSPDAQTGTSETAATSFRRGLRIARRLSDV